MIGNAESVVPPASILGIGAVTPIGRDLASIALRLAGQGSSTSAASLQLALGKSEPGAADALRAGADAGDRSPDGPVEADSLRRVADALLSEPSINAHMRRADRFGKMSAIAAIDAWNAATARHGAIAGERVGLIFSSGFGAHVRGFKFLDGVLDHGDAAASPTDFSHSVHGAAAAYISRMLDIRGPSLPLTDFQLGFEHAVQLAQIWLHEKTCDRVLIGAVEELGNVMIDCAGKMLDRSSGIRAGEGAVFLVLAAAGVPGAATIDACAAPLAADLLIAEDPPMPGSAKIAPSICARRTATFADYFGHSSSLPAFNVLAGLMSIQSALPLGRTMAIDAPRGEPSPVDNVCTFRASSDGAVASVFLRGKSTGDAV